MRRSGVFQDVSSDRQAELMCSTAHHQFVNQRGNFDDAIGAAIVTVDGGSPRAVGSSRTRDHDQRDVPGALPR
jgi:hypothetical protein